MTKTIKLETTDEQIKDIETVSLRFTGALIEGGEALEDQFRIPNVRFEIRLKTGQVIEALADESGKFTTKAIEFKIPQGVLQSTAYRVLHVLVDVQANDGIETIMKTVKLDVARLLEQHRNYKTLIEVKNNLEKEKRREEEARMVEAEKRAEEARKAESARKMEAAKKAEEARKTEIKTAAVIEVELTKAIGVINGYGDREPRKAFEVLVEHSDHPSINGYLNKINFQGTGVVVDYYPIYKNTKWAISLAKRAIDERLSKGYSLNINPFLYEGWFPEFFIHLAEKYPKEILKWLVELSHFDFVEKAAILIAQKEPDLILGMKHKLSDLPWGQKVVMLADTLRKKIDFETAERERPARERKEAFELANSNPEETLRNLRKYINQPWITALVMTLARQKIDRLLDQLSSYKDQPWIKQAVMTAVGCHSSYCYSLLRCYLDQPWIEEAIMLLISSHKVDSIGWLEPLLDLKKPWVIKVIEAAMKKQERDLYYTWKHNNNRKIRDEGFARDLYQSALCGMGSKAASKYMDDQAMSRHEMEEARKTNEKVRREQTEKRKRDEYFDKAFHPIIYQIKKIFGDYDD